MTSIIKSYRTPRRRWGLFIGLTAVALLAPLEVVAESDSPIKVDPQDADAEDDDNGDDESDESAAVDLGPVVVTTTGRELALDDVYQPTTLMEGDELQRNLDSSVPATLGRVPGFHAEYNGPGASRPTMRGLPGNRVLMLEDGHRTGDIYWTASDHGVMVEPLSAARMEVVRGPSGLLYGSNALGGAVNVVRQDVPEQNLDEVRGMGAGQFQSVNMGGGAAAMVRGPLKDGDLNFYGEASGRLSGDDRTPEGPIEGTDMRVFGGAAGLSWTPDWGVVGAAARHYDNVYGIPGDFDGELIPGGHPGGVHSEATRSSGRLLARTSEVPGIVDDLELRSSVTRFSHDEIEGTIDDEDILGASFDQWTTDSRLIARHEPVGDEDDDQWTLEGAAGLAVHTRDLEAGGAAPGTRSGFERDAGLFAFEQFGLDPVRVQVGARYDFRHVDTLDHSTLRTRTEERTIEKQPRARTFQALSASVSAMYAFAEDWTVGTNLARSFRHPTIEELYSDGPHLADFSYDIGDPDLDTEIGYGADLFIRSAGDSLSVELTGFFNYIDGFIYYAPTGETVRVFREGVPPRTTPVFEARGEDAMFMGAESRVQWEVVDNWFVDATASYTRATRIADDDPLPFIPPLSGQLELQYDTERFFGSLGADLGAAQNRVPRPIQIGDETEEVQRPTPGYALAHAMVGYRHPTEMLDHTLMLRAENVADSVWRDHSSQLNQVAPQPGRNIQLTYRADF